MTVNLLEITYTVRILVALSVNLFEYQKFDSHFYKEVPETARLEQISN